MTLLAAIFQCADTTPQLRSTRFYDEIVCWPFQPRVALDCQVDVAELDKKSSTASYWTAWHGQRQTALSRVRYE